MAKLNICSIEQKKPFLKLRGGKTAVEGFEFQSHQLKISYTHFPLDLYSHSELRGRDQNKNSVAVSTDQDVVYSVSLLSSKFHHFLPICFVVWLLLKTKQFEYFSCYEVLLK